MKKNWRRFDGAQDNVATAAKEETYGHFETYKKRVIRDASDKHQIYSLDKKTCSLNLTKRASFREF